MLVLASADVVVVDGIVGVDVVASRGGGGVLNEGCRVCLVYFHVR